MAITIKVKHTSGVRDIGAEYVGPGHPDKTADGISGAIVHENVLRDPFAHVAAETILSSTGRISLHGEITSRFIISPAKYIQLVRNYVQRLGWTKELGYDPHALVIDIDYTRQSPDIAQGVEPDRREVKAGDQGFSIGYAIRNPERTLQTDDLMPVSISFVRAMLLEIDEIRRTGKDGGILKPDMKSEVSLKLDRYGRPKEIERIVLALSHVEKVHPHEIKKLITPLVAQITDQYGLKYDIRNAIVNGTGRFVIAGAPGDTGLTGRKIVVDGYGPNIPVGGGAFWGKDPSKADLTGAMLARWIAKQVVGNKLVDECFVKLVWAIGYAKPITIVLEFAGTQRKSDAKIISMLQKIDFSLGAAIERFGMRRINPEGHNPSGINYPQLAAVGAFGKFDDASTRPWETVVEPGKWKEWEFSQSNT